MSPFFALKSINRITPGNMLDVGTRDGRIAAQFVEAGYSVDAIDPSEPPNGADLEGINFQQSTLENFSSSKTYDLVVASMVSQFVSYSIPDFIGRLKDLTAPEGLIYVTLLGDEDEWAGNPKAKAVTFGAAEEIIADHELVAITKSIDWIQGFLYSGEPKFWHRFTFVLSHQGTS